MIRARLQPDMQSSLYIGHVFHKRLRPRIHSLKLTVFSVLLDIDEVQQLQNKMWLFSHNRFNLFSFYDKDFGENPEEPLSDFVRRKLLEVNISTRPSQIMLSCYPRVLGRSFNPISLFYCFDEHGRLFAVIHEVHSTFGERHAYVLPVTEKIQPPYAVNTNTAASTETAPKWIEQACEKALFVSPFNHMDMHYTFRFNCPDETLILGIKVHDENGHFLSASYKAKRSELNSLRLMRLFFSIPMLSFKVVIGIHWHALRLWLKRVPWYRHIPKQSVSNTHTR